MAKPYFDDIIVGTRREPGMTDEQLIGKHMADVTRLMERLEADRWVADKDKARLLMSRVEFCGHLLGGGKRTPAPGKLSAVQHWQPPPTITALRAFLGLCNYYASYVRMFAQLAAPLQEKLKVPRELGKAGSKHRIDWTPEELKAFDTLKQALVADLELYHIDSRKPFALRTDASQYAIGAALEQFPKHDDGGDQGRMHSGGWIYEPEADTRTAGPMGHQRQRDICGGQRIGAVGRIHRIQQSPRADGSQELGVMAQGACGRNGTHRKAGAVALQAEQVPDRSDPCPRQHQHCGRCTKPMGLSGTQRI